MIPQNRLHISLRASSWTPDAEGQCMGQDTLVQKQVVLRRVRSQLLIVQADREVLTAYPRLNGRC